MFDIRVLDSGGQNVMYRDVFVMFFVAIYEILSGNLMMLIEYLHNLPILFPIENIPQICTFFEKEMI